MATIAPFGIYRAFDENGDPLQNGKLYTYAAGTATPLATYTTAAGDVENLNPTILDADGYANVWLGDGGYKFVLKDENDVTQFTVDNIGGSSSAAFGAMVNSITTNTNITSVYANSINECSGSITLSLLPVSAAEEGFYFSVTVLSGSTIIDPDAGETINGSSTLTITSGNSALIYCNGTSWRTLFYFGNLTSAATTAIGTSGATIPLLNGNNTYSGTFTLSSAALTHTFAGPISVSNFNTTTPGVNAELLYQEGFSGFDSAGNSQLYSTDNIFIVDAASGSEDSKRQWKNFIAGVDTTVMELGGGVTLGAATSGDQGVGTINSTNYYKNGTLGALAATYTSPNQTITSAGLLSLTHSLGGAPDVVQYFLVCLTGEINYTAGDVIAVNQLNTSTAANRANTPTITSTQILVRFSDAAQCFTAGDKTTGTLTVLTNANWALRVKAIRFI